MNFLTVILLIRVPVLCVLPEKFSEFTLEYVSLRNNLMSVIFTQIDMENITVYIQYM